DHLAAIRLDDDAVVIGTDLTHDAFDVAEARGRSIARRRIAGRGSGGAGRRSGLTDADLVGGNAASEEDDVIGGDHCVCCTRAAYLDAIAGADVRDTLRTPADLRSADDHATEAAVRPQ